MAKFGQMNESHLATEPITESPVSETCDHARAAYGNQLRVRF